MSNDKIPMFTDLEEIIKLDYEFYTKLINDGVEHTEAFLTATINFMYKDIDVNSKQLHLMIDRISTSVCLHNLEKAKALSEYSDIELRAELCSRYLSTGMDEFDLNDDEEIELNPVDDYVVDFGVIESEAEKEVKIINYESLTEMFLSTNLTKKEMIVYNKLASKNDIIIIDSTIVLDHLIEEYNLNIKRPNLYKLIKSLTEKGLFEKILVDGKKALKINKL